MKAVPKVNTDGLYLEDTLVDDAFTGVAPFYDIPPAPDEHPEEEPQPAGYIVGVPVPAGLYLPRFDLTTWEQDDSLDPDAYWVESLTPEEIENLKQPAQVTPEKVLAMESVKRELDALELKQQNVALGSQVVEQELILKKLETQYEALGKSMVTLELKLLELTKGANKGDGQSV